MSNPNNEEIKKIEDLTEDDIQTPEDLTEDDFESELDNE